MNRPPLTLEPLITVTPEAAAISDAIESATAQTAKDTLYRSLRGTQNVPTHEVVAALLGVLKYRGELTDEIRSELLKRASGIFRSEFKIDFYASDMALREELRAQHASGEINDRYWKLFSAYAPTGFARPVDLSEETGDRELPTLLRRSDGKGLIYPGRTTILYGQASSGKSFVASMAIAQVLQDGGICAFVDYEDSPSLFVSRLLALGVSRTRINDVRYFNMRDTELEQVVGYLTGIARCDLVVIDSITPALAKAGVSSVGAGSNEATVSFFNRTFARITSETGAAVLAIDHAVKSDETGSKGPGGGPQKTAGIDGSIISVPQVASSRRLEPGKPDRAIRLKVGAKDRAGALHELSSSPSADGTAEIALINIDATDPEHLDWSIDAPGGAKHDVDKGKALGYIRNHPGASPRSIREALRIRQDKISAILAELEEDGDVTIVQGGRGGGKKLYAAGDEE